MISRLECCCQLFDWIFCCLELWHCFCLFVSTTLHRQSEAMIIPWVCDCLGVPFSGFKAPFVWSPLLAHIYIYMHMCHVCDCFFNQQRFCHSLMPEFVNACLLGNAQRAQTPKLSSHIGRTPMCSFFSCMGLLQRGDGIGGTSILTPAPLSVLRKRVPRLRTVNP